MRFHGKISANVAISRLLQGDDDDPIGRYLVRKDRGNLIISYVNKKKSVKHILVPRLKKNLILKNNPHLSKKKDIVDYMELKMGGKLLVQVDGGNGDEDENEDGDDNNDDEEDEDCQDDVDFKCYVCDMQFGSAQSLRHHTTCHKMTYCPKCSIIYSAASRHQCTANMQHKCTSCDFQTNYTSNLRTHQIMHHENPDVRNCGLCPKTFLSQKRLENHLAVFHKLGYKCASCPSTFSTRYKKTQHEKEIHPSSLDQGQSAGPVPQVSSQTCSSPSCQHSNNDEVPRCLAYSLFLIYLPYAINCHNMG